jgi:hypothetical protein
MLIMLLLLQTPGSAPGSIKQTQLLLVVSSCLKNHELAAAAAVVSARQDTRLQNALPGCSYSVAGPSSSALVHRSPPLST